MEEAALAVVKKRGGGARPNSGRTNDLSDRERAFVYAYARTWNVSQAAREAGYSERSVGQLGTEALKRPRVRELLRETLAELAHPAELTLARLSQQARNAGADFFSADANGRLAIDLKGLLAAGLGHLIKGCRETKYGQEILFHDAQPALALLARHQGLIEPDTTNIQVNVVTQQVMQLSGEDALRALGELLLQAEVAPAVCDYVLARLGATARVEVEDPELEAVWTSE